MSTTNNTLELGCRRKGFSPRAFMSWFQERIMLRSAQIGFDLIILVVMALMLMAAALALGGSIRILQASVILPVIITVAALVTKARRRPHQWRLETRQGLRDWVPFLIIVFIYENMHDVAGGAMSFDIAGTLQEWDMAIFGVEPTLWAQGIHSPLLTDLMSISYALYFAQPLFIMFLLSVWNMRREFSHMALSMTITFILGFLGYVFLPCSPPRYYIEHLFTDPVRLHGLFVFEIFQGAWDSLSVVAGGAFPSLHVAISSVALIYAWRYRNLNRLCRGIFYAYIPLVTSLWFSTVYLRHHWVIDIFAGWAVAGTAYVCAGMLTRLRARLCLRFGVPF